MDNDIISLVYAYRNICEQHCFKSVNDSHNYNYDLELQNFKLKCLAHLTQAEYCNRFSNKLIRSFYSDNCSLSSGNIQAILEGIYVLHDIILQLAWYPWKEELETIDCYSGIYCYKLKDLLCHKQILEAIGYFLEDSAFILDKSKMLDISELYDIDCNLIFCELECNMIEMMLDYDSDAPISLKDAYLSRVEFSGDAISCLTQYITQQHENEVTNLVYDTTFTDDLNKHCTQKRKLPYVNNFYNNTTKINDMSYAAIAGSLKPMGVKSTSVSSDRLLGFTKHVISDSKSGSGNSDDIICEPPVSSTDVLSRNTIKNNSSTRSYPITSRVSSSSRPICLNSSATIDETNTIENSYSAKHQAANRHSSYTYSNIDSSYASETVSSQNKKLSSHKTYAETVYMNTDHKKKASSKNDKDDFQLYGSIYPSKKSDVSNSRQQTYRSDRTSNSPAYSLSSNYRSSFPTASVSSRPTALTSTKINPAITKEVMSRPDAIKKRNIDSRICKHCEFALDITSSICKMCSKSADFVDDDLPSGGKVCQVCSYINPVNERWYCQACNNPLKSAGTYV